MRGLIGRLIKYKPPQDKRIRWLEYAGKTGTIFAVEKDASDNFIALVLFDDKKFRRIDLEYAEHSEYDEIMEQFKGAL